MLAKFRDNFIIGIAVILPATVTMWLLAIVGRAINDRILGPLTKLFKPYIINIYFEYVTRTIILFVLIIIIVLIGLATRILFIRRFFSSGERMFFRIPMVGKIYIIMKQMSRVIFRERKAIFKATVLVEYPRKGLYSIGFLTSDSKGEIQSKTEKKLVNIFLPTTPNPTTGILLLASEDEIVRLDMSIEEAIKLIISAGIVSSEKLQET